MIEAIKEIGQNSRNLETLRDHYKQGGKKPTLFIGAGLSIPFGFPSWADFLINAVDAPDEQNEIKRLISNGLYEEASERVIQSLETTGLAAKIDQIYDDPNKLELDERSGTVCILPYLTDSPVITTNYDRVLETVFAAAHKPFENVIKGNESERIIKESITSNNVLIKIHGDARERQGRILSKAEYDRAYGSKDKPDLKKDLPGALAQIATNRSILFLGCRLQTDRTLKVLHEAAERTQRAIKYFAVIERPETGVDERFKELSQLNIIPIWYKTGEHDSVKTILDYLHEATVRAPDFEEDTQGTEINTTDFEEESTRVKEDTTDTEEDTSGKTTEDPPAPERPNKKPWNDKRVLIAYGVLVVAMLVALFAKSFSFAASEPEHLRIGVYEPDEDAEQHKAHVNQFIAEFNKLLDPNNSWDLRETATVFTDYKSAWDAFQKKEIDILGELSPRQVFEANRDAEAVPFISPIHDGSGVYESSFFVANWWLKEQNISQTDGATLKPEVWHKALHHATTEENRYILTMNKKSTSGYWYPRSLLLRYLDSQEGLDDVLGAEHQREAEDILVADVADTKIKNDFAGVVASFRLAQSPNRTKVTVVKEIPMIPNGAFIIQSGLARNSDVLEKLRDYWEPARSRATSVPEDEFPMNWFAVDTTHYASAFEVFRKVESAEASDGRSNLIQALSFVGVILLVAVAAFLNQSRERDKVEP